MLFLTKGKIVKARIICINDWSEWGNLSILEALKIFFVANDFFRLCLICSFFFQEKKWIERNKNQRQKRTKMLTKWAILLLTIERVWWKFWRYEFWPLYVMYMVIIIIIICEDLLFHCLQAFSWYCNNIDIIIKKECTDNWLSNTRKIGYARTVKTLNDT